MKTQKLQKMTIFLALWMGLSSVTKAVNNEELKIGIAQEFESLNFIIATSAAAKYVLYFVYRPMVFLDIEGKWQGHLVNEIPSLANKKAKLIKKEGKTFLESQWDLKESAKWGDGTPVTCKDLKLGWDIWKNPNVSVGNREPATYIDSITWSDKTPKKCTVVFNKARWDFYQSLPDPMPSHLEQTVLDQWGPQGQGYDRNTNYTRNPTLPGLYNGPYVVSEVALGSHLILTPNPYFYGKKPKIKKILLRIIPNTNTLESNLRSQSIDMIGVLGMSFDQGLAFEQKVKKEKLPYEVKFKTSSVFQHIDLNLSQPFLKDLRVRQALSLGFNKEEIGKTLFENRATLTNHWMMPIDEWFTNDPKVVTVYPYDRKKAKKLLDEAGWKPGPDGYRYKEGQKLSLKLVGATGYKIIENLQAILQAQWKDLGIEILIKNSPGRLLFSEILKKGQFDLGLFSWSSFPGQVPESLFHSKNVPSEKNMWTGQNFPHWINPEVDKAIESITEEWISQKRQKYVDQIVKAYTQEIPVIPLLFRPDVAITPKNLKGFELTGQQFYDSSYVENWELQSN